MSGDSSAPVVSVVMPVFNAGRDLEQAVAGVRAQTMPNFELLLVDDASTDGCTDFIADLDDSRIRVIRNGSNLGPAASRNVALRDARASLVAIADADDISAPTRFAVQSRHLLAHPDVDLVAGGSARFTADGDPMLAGSPLTTHVGLSLALRYATSITHSSVMMRREPVVAIGGYRPETEFSEDYDLYTRLVLSGHRLSAVPDVVVAYRHSDSSVSHANADQSTSSSRSIRATYRDEFEVPGLRDLVRAVRSEAATVRPSARLRLLKILGRIALGRCGANRTARLRCGLACASAGPSTWLALLRGRQR